MTDVEKRLWLRLQGAQLAGVSFRRQHPLGRYIVDFCAVSLKLVVELDGSQHRDEVGKRKDTLRTEWLKAQGFYVLRFWNTEIVENLDGVLEEIARVVDEQKTTPS